MKTICWTSVIVLYTIFHRLNWKCYLSTTSHCAIYLKTMESCMLSASCPLHHTYVTHISTPDCTNNALFYSVFYGVTKTAVLPRWLAVGTMAVLSNLGPPISFSFYGHSTVRTIPFHFYWTPRFCWSTIADSALIHFRMQQVIFDTTYLRLEVSYRHGMKSNI